MTISHCQDLTGLFIYDMDGTNRVRLEGVYNAQHLASKLADEWIPYWECEKCGRSASCAFTQPNTYRPDRLADIKCGAIAQALTNFIVHTYSEVLGQPNEAMQCYLDGAFYFFKFIYDAEITLGAFIHPEFAKDFGEYAPLFFGRIVRFREYLDSAAFNLKSLPQFYVQKGILLVEGQSELIFLQEMRRTGFWHLIELKAETYGGRDNKRVRRIEMLLQDYVKRGYVVYLVGDADGRSKTTFKEIADCHLITYDHTFVFSYDFESSIPTWIICEAVNRLFPNKIVDKLKFQEDRSTFSGSVLKLLEMHGVNELASDKVKFAKEVADILICNQAIWIQNQEFNESELGQFLDFLLKMRH